MMENTIYGGKEVKIIANENGKRLTPSVVALARDDRSELSLDPVLIGDAAVNTKNYDDYGSLH